MCWKAALMSACQLSDLLRVFIILASCLTIHLTVPPSVCQPWYTEPVKSKQRPHMALWHRGRKRRHQRGLLSNVCCIFIIGLTTEEDMVNMPPPPSWGTTRRPEELSTVQLNAKSSANKQNATQRRAGNTEEDRNRGALRGTHVTPKGNHVCPSHHRRVPVGSRSKNKRVVWTNEIRFKVTVCSCSNRQCFYSSTHL